MTQTEEKVALVHRVKTDMLTPPSMGQRSQRTVYLMMSGASFIE